MVGVGRRRVLIPSWLRRRDLRRLLFIILDVGLRFLMRMGGIVVVCFVYIGDEYPGLSDGWMALSLVLYITSLYIFFGWLAVDSEWT